MPGLFVLYLVSGCLECCSVGRHFVGVGQGQKCHPHILDQLYTQNA